MTIEKPQGYELRVARCEKNGESARFIAPMDAVYDAVEAMKGKEVMALMITWYEKGPNGLPVVKYRLSTTHPREGLALVADTQFEMQLVDRDG